MFTANIVPGYGFQEVEIYIKRHGKTASGRVTEVGYQPAEQAFLGIAAEASQHPITHTVVQYGATVKAKATDYLVFPDGRKFYVQGVDNAGSLNVSMIYYVEERFDIK